MADTKISSLTELTSLAADDELVVVDKSDTAMAGSGTDKRVTWETIQATGTERLERYVDYANGDDANPGLKPESAMETIQAAYDDLKTVTAGFASTGTNLPVGTIYLAPGQHDVDTGLVISFKRPVKIVGTRSGMPPANQMNDASSIIMTSSGSATELVLVGSDSDQMFGTEFEQVAFRLSGACTAGIRIKSTCHFKAERCTFDADADMAAWAVVATNFAAGDCSWGRLLECQTYNIGLCNLVSTNAGFMNYWRILNNSCLSFGDEASNPLILTKCLGFNVSGNDLEDTAAAPTPFMLTQVLDSTFYANTTEGPQAGKANPVFDLNSCQGNIIEGGSHTFNGAAALDGKFADLDSSSFGNVIRYFRITRNDDVTTTSNNKQRVTDANTGGARNVIWGQRGLRAMDNMAFFLPGLSSDPALQEGAVWYNTATDTYMGNPNGTAAKFLLEGDDLGVDAGNAFWERGTTAYSASITPDVTALSTWYAVVSDTNAFTINAPTGMVDGQVVSFMLINESVGTMGDVTWDSAFVTDWSNATDKPASFESKRSILTFTYVQGLTEWHQTAKMVNHHGSYSDEQAQDAVGTALTDSSTVDFTYDDGANTITAIVAGGSIDNAHIASSAGIAKSKLAALSIVNADVNAAAAIAQTKIANLGNDLALGGQGGGFPPTGVTYQNFGRYVPTGTGSTLTAGSLRLSALWLPAGFTVTNITFCSGPTALITAGTGPHLWFALYDSSRVLLRQTADDTAASWAATALKTVNLSSTFVTTYTGLHYVGVMVHAGSTGTMPNAINVAAAAGAFGGIAPIISGNSTTSLGATAPDPAAAITSLANMVWCGVA